MPIRVLELHHHAVRVGAAAQDLEQSRQFYTEVLGLEVDAGRPEIPGLPGYWLYVGQGQQTAQIHLMGAGNRSPLGEIDPTMPHVALAVEDIQEARHELERRGIRHWALASMVGEQIFMLDPCGNVVELHQVGTCRCNKSTLR